MKKIFFIISLLVFVAAAPVPDPNKNLSLHVSGVTVSQLADAAFDKIEGVGYVLDPEILKDDRTLSVNIEGFFKTFDPDVVGVFRSLGYSVSQEGKLRKVSRIPDFAPPKADRRLFVYQPKFRDVNYLTEALRVLFPDGQFSASSGGSSALSFSPMVPSLSSVGLNSSLPSSAPSSSSPVVRENSSGLVSSGADCLIFYGVSSDVLRLKEALAQIDVPVSDVAIDAVVYEVQITKDEGSALRLAYSLLRGKASLGLSTITAATASTADSFLEIKAAGLDAVVSALDTNSRFKVVSSPSVRVRSGGHAVFTSGAQVPVLGSTTTSSTGSTTQGIVYQDSGVIFNVSPVVHTQIVNLDVDQELSNFVQTTTGVNASPTLNKRALQSSISLGGGSTIILGGLTLDQNTDAKQGFGFLPAFADSESVQSDRTEILLVLHVRVIPN